MSIFSKPMIGMRCKLCGATMVQYHMKNPFIDDVENECSNAHCTNHGGAVDRLQSLSNSVARAEERREHDESERDDKTGEE